MSTIQENTTAPPSPSGSQRNVSLVRCRKCKRTEEFLPAEVARWVTLGGAPCCGEVMDLYIPAKWPGLSSAVIKAPTPRTSRS